MEAGIHARFIAAGGGRTGFPKMVSPSRSHSYATIFPSLSVESAAPSVRLPPSANGPDWF